MLNSLTTNSSHVKQTYNINSQPNLLPRIPKVLSMSKKKQQQLLQNLTKASPTINKGFQDKNKELSEVNQAKTTSLYSYKSENQNNQKSQNGSSFIGKGRGDLKIAPFEIQLKINQNKLKPYKRITRQFKFQSPIQKQKTQDISLSDQKNSLSHSGVSTPLDASSNIMFEKLDSANYYDQVIKDEFQSPRFLTSMNSNQFDNQKYPSQETYYERPVKSKQIRKQVTRSASVDMNNSQVNEKNSKNYLVQNKFYQYCTDQIVKISMQNEALKINLAKKEEILYNLNFKNKEIELLNKKLQNQAQISKKQQIIAQKEKKILKKQIQKYQQKIENVPQMYKSEYKERLKQFKVVLSERQQKINSQNKEIESLTRQIKQANSANTQTQRLKQQNQRLWSQIAKLKKKQTEYDNKVYRKNHVINHLQEVKKVEFQNLFDILQEMK